MRILVIEDDPHLNRQLCETLRAENYAVDKAFDGEEGHFLGDTEPYDAIILDLGLPEKDGLSVLRDWRAEGKLMPVLILTARDRWTDKVQGIDAGADDYLTKPFHMQEVLARIRALLRRSKGMASNIIESHGLELDMAGNTVALNGMPVKLTAQEYRLLAYLMTHPDKVITRTELTEHIYEQDFDRDSNTIEVFIGRLRRKIGSNRILTHRGMGYQLGIPNRAKT